ncbi:hypothetical protein GCM10012280_63630 [Wenjunlia tyrosinilytica]|uniref:Uncharacterized protein n=1 Tax=Wenjunlia tyrosinilytica TaxID=1544741 RepID=A0A918E1T7_9ACTN|nr:hypothetical protein GCM10012280_63630 [Wenjunlia tyrosinilytica]
MIQQIEDDRATVYTGVHTADVEVTLSLHRGEPAPDLRHWQEVVEVSLHFTTGELQLRAMGADLERDFPPLSFNGPGDYRIRVRARGRDTAVDGAPDDIVEWYLILAWPPTTTTAKNCAPPPPAHTRRPWARRRAGRMTTRRGSGSAKPGSAIQATTTSRAGTHVPRQCAPSVSPSATASPRGARRARPGPPTTSSSSWSAGWRAP